MLLVFQEECNGKRSRNPSTSSSYGLRIGGYRSRRASEGDDGASSSSRGGARSRGSSRHSSGGQDRKPAYRCEGNTESKSLKDILIPIHFAEDGTATRATQTAGLWAPATRTSWTRGWAARTLGGGTPAGRGRGPTAPARRWSPSAARWRSSQNHEL